MEIDVFARRAHAARSGMVIAHVSICLALAGAAPPAGPSPEPSPRLVVEPAAFVVGDPLTVRVTGARPGGLVVVTAERFSARRRSLYRSAATFVADDAGTVDLSEDAPLAAPWQGVDPRGLFWSMAPTGEELKEPAPWSLVRLGADVDADGTADVERVLDLGPAESGLVETPLGEPFPGAFLLRPAGGEPLPAVIALGGSEGGDSGARGIAPNLAARGYAVLGLPYYSPAWGEQPQQFPGLPRAFHEIPLERLEAARDWLRARDDIRADRIGIWGVSKGAELALAGASRMDGFAAIAAIVPSDVVWEGWGSGAPAGTSSSFSWRGEPLAFVPYLGMGAEFAKRSRGQAVRLRLPHDAGRLAHPERVEPARIRVEEIAAALLVVGGDDDDVWDSGGMARNIAEARSAAGLETVLIVDPAAGHGLSGHGYSPADPPDARVQGEAFLALLQFYDEHLRGTCAPGADGE